MFGCQRVKLFSDNSITNKIIDFPQTNNLKLVFSGNDIDILLEAEGQTEEDVHKNLQKQLNNLKLYVNLYSDNTIKAVIHDNQKIFSDKNEYAESILNSLDKLRDSNLPNYLNKHIIQQHILLQTALDELQKGDLFNAFPKLINWLDENDGKGSSRFCSIRDSCNHGTLNQAIKKTNNLFPNEFEFEDNIMKRDSEKNLDSIKKYLPEVLDHVKQVFKRDFVN